MEEVLKKQSQSDIWKTINGELNKPQNGRGQILLVHLYCDYFMNHLYSVMTKKDIEKVEHERFSDKREFLYKNKIIDETLNNDLKIVNRIRNELGHKLHPDFETLLKTLEEHSNYWAKNVMKDLGTYGKIRFVTIDTVSKIFQIFWKILIKPTMDKINS